MRFVAGFLPWLGLRLLAGAGFAWLGQPGLGGPRHARLLDDAPVNVVRGIADVQQGFRDLGRALRTER